MLEKNNGKNNSNKNRRVGTNKNNRTNATRTNKTNESKSNTMNKKTYGVKGKKQKNASKNTKTKKIVIRVLIGLFVAILIGMAILAGIVIGIFKKSTVPVESIMTGGGNTVVLDTDGNVIATLSADEKRNNITLEEMSPYIPKAFVAIEDERFYEHDGVDLKRTAAATIGYIFKGNSSFGGSTITQQLIKNKTKENQRDATRKIKEIARAYNLEKELQKDKTKSQVKDEILQVYLNTIFMGEDGVCGVQLASKLYFNKNASELDLAESAFLAGINNSPNAYKPFEDSDAMREKIKNRTLTVLDKMHELKKIDSEEEYNAAKEKVQNGLPFSRGEIHTTVYSYHTDALIEQLIAQIQEEYPEMNRKGAEEYLYNGGFVIYSTQVSSIQKVMEEEYNTGKFILSRVVNEKDNDGKDKKDENGKTIQKTITTESSMVIVDHKTGQVVATVGGFGQKTARCLNRATQVPKQAGSSLKPLAVIAPSLQEGLITAGTVIDDTPVRYGNWVPNNDTHNFWGLTTVRTIIRNSRNIPEIKMINTLTPKKSVEYLRQFGLKSVCEQDENAATALGGLTYGTTTLEMAAAYATIANDGVYIEPTFYTRMEDANGNIVMKPNQETRTVISADNAYILKSILREPVQSGTAVGLGVKVKGMDTCGKTGTTDANQRWFCGFTPYYAAATWFGYDDQTVKLAMDTNRAGLLWGNVMRRVHSELNLEAKNFQRTGNITSATICNKSGLLATDLCRTAGCAYSEEFVKGTTPTKSCETHVTAKVCGEDYGSYKLATENCPDAKEVVFITRPNSDTDTSWQSAGDAKLMLPTENCDVHTEPIVEPSPEPSPTPSPSPKPSPSASPSPSPSASPSAVPTTTPTPTPTPAVPSPQPTTP